MNTKSLMMLKVLLNRYHEKNLKDYVSLLPAEQSQTLMRIQTDFNNPEAILWDADKKISKIHYTWYVPMLKDIPQEEASWMLLSLPEATAAKVSKACHIPSQTTKLSPFARALASHYLWKLVESPEVVPLEFIPQSQLSFLLDYSREDLMEIIDLLGVYDLAERVRYIVDKKRLKDIYSSLKPLEQKFLQTCLNQQGRKSIISPLNISDWSGDKAVLRQKLHRRGLSRLGYALMSEDPNFLWYFVRKFDTGRGKILQECVDNKKIPEGVSAVLIQHLLNLVNFRNKKDSRES